MKAEVRLSAPSFERLPEPAKVILYARSKKGADNKIIDLTVHNPHSPITPVTMENRVDSIPIPVVLYAERDMRRVAPVIGVING